MQMSFISVISLNLIELHHSGSFFAAFSWQEEPLLQAGSEERPQGFREVHQGQEGEEKIPQSALDHKD